MRHGLLADRGMPPSRQRRRGGGGVRAWCERVEGLAAIAVDTVAVDAAPKLVFISGGCPRNLRDSKNRF